MKSFTVGIDSGSRTTKIVVLNKRNLIFSDITDTGVNPKKTAEKLYHNALLECSLSESEISAIYSTGYGRNIVLFADKKVSEITCHARGVNFLFPEARTVIDIGGQDSKVILLDENGKVSDFVMNDKCAAGTGRFLEVVAHIFEITVDDLGDHSLNSKKEIDINNTCVVFAESEIIGLISLGNRTEDIIMAVHRSIAKRTKNLLSQLAWRKPLVFTGGVAKNCGMKKALSVVLNSEIITPDYSSMTGALGAALFAGEL